MNFGLVYEHREVWPVRAMCVVMGLSVGGYYAWRGGLENRRAAADRTLLDDIRLIHAESGPMDHRACAPFCAATTAGSDAHASTGWCAAKVFVDLPPCRVGPERQSAPRLSDRAQQARPQLHRPGLNQIWLTGPTYIGIDEGWLCLAAILGQRTCKIVGWAFSVDLRARVVLAALDMAVAARRPGNVILHSDRGIQCAAEVYRADLARSGITPSMSRMNCC
jgi:putative transposase